MKIFNLQRMMRTALLLLLMTGATKAFAQAQFTVGYFHYTITDAVNHEVAIGCDIYTTLPEGYVGELPSTVTYENVTYTVTSISNNAFGNCNKIMGVAIPATVTSIGDYAFTGCENMQAVGIPNTVEDIGDGAFNGCVNLQSVKWPENANCWEIKQYTFRDCSSLRKFNVPDNVTTINKEAFSTCTDLQEVYLSSNLTHINAYAFKHCSALIGVYSYNMYPPLINATTFSEAFAMDAKIYVPAESLYRYQTAYWAASVNFAWPVRSSDVTADMIEVMPAHKFLKYEYVDDDNDNVIARVIGYIPGISGDLVIPETVSSFNVTEIDVQALEECTGITSVTFPATLTSIGEYAFNGCTGLTTIDLSACNELTTTGKRTFVDCDNATSVILPANLNTIGNHSFAGCNALATIEIPGAVTRIEIGAFLNCTALTSITFPQSLGIIEQQAFHGCTALASITALRTLPPRAHDHTFANVTKTIPVNIPYGATANYNTADGWSDFTNFVELPANTLLYSYDDVNHTATLTGHVGEVSGLLEIPTVVTKNNVDYTVTAISDNAFIGCSGLTSVTFPATLTSIGQYAFRECTGITSLVIPSTLTDLGDGAFLWCTSLAEVTLPDNLTRIGKGMFEGAAFTEIELPNSLQVIDKLAFYATSLTSVTLPESVTAIGEMAFRDCLDLEYVVALPTTPPTINANSFEHVENIPLYTSETSYDAYNDDPLWSIIFNTSCRPGLIYNTQTTTATVSGCTPNYVGDLVIPSAFGNKTVVGIEANALKDQQYITSVSIPASVTSIGKWSFKNCPSLASFTVDASNTEYKAVNDVLFNKADTELVAYPAGKVGTSYAVPSGVTKIWDNAFDGSSLISIALSASVTTLGSFNVANNAFEGASKLSSITVDNNNTTYSANGGLLFNKEGTKLMVCPEGKSGTYTVPANVTAIDRFAFLKCKKLTNIIMNDGLQTLDEAAFNTCTGLTSIIIPSTVSTIKGGAFNNCANLQVLTCYCTTFPTSSSNPFQIGVNPELIIYVRGDLLSTYQTSEYWNVFDLQVIAEPNANIQYSYDDTDLTATVIGLYDNTVTGALTLPATVIKPNTNTPYTVTAIADNAFKDNTGLTSVDIAHTVETIGNYAFSGCIGVTELTIGRNVKTIGDYAFYNCYNINTIHYYALNGQSVADNAWLVDAVDVATIPEKTLDIKNCVQAIPACCFYALYGLRNATVTIPNSVTSIGDWAFRYSDINGISIGSGVKTIGYRAFERSGLQSIELPSNVKNIENYAFIDCHQLTSAIVWGAKRISVGMFKNCTALTSFDVKSATKMINSYAFMGCTNLTTLTTAGYASNLTTIGQEAFGGCTALTAIDIPNSVTTIHDYAFAGDSALKTVVLGTGLNSVGFAAFYYCSALENITFNATHCNSFSSKVWEGTGNDAKTLTIGTNVNVIPSRAFENLKGFTSVTLPNSLTNIYYNAFNGCDLTSITIPNNVTWIGTEAFQNCPLTTLSIGSKVNRIGSDAFNGDSNYLHTITSYKTTPPNIDGPTFHNDAYTNATLKVLGNDAVTAYRNHVVWSRFTNTESLDGYYFTGATDNNWGTASNWSNGTVPTTELYEEVTAVIMADARVNITDAFVNFFTIMDGTTVTIASGKSLKIGDGGNGSFNSSGASALVVEDGGSLVNNLNQNIAATVEKNIAGHNGNAGKWYFVSSPIVGANTYEENYNVYYYTSPNIVENLFANPANNYDLYAFDQSAAEAEWVNYKQHSEDFKLVDGNGYLYANHDNVTLSFAGDVRPCNSDYPMTPVFKQDMQIVYNNPDNPDEGYYEQTVDYPFTGWNLVGNPFTCNAYIKDDYSILSSGFYKMNPDGTGITSVEGFSEEIPAGTGVFVKVSDEYNPMSGNQYAFTTETPMRGFTKGSLQVVLKQALMRGDAVQVDNAIVSFNEGNPLEKFVLFRDDAHIAIPQNGKKYAIVCAEPCGEMPLNLDAVMDGRFTLEVAPKDVEMSYLHLIDNLTGTDVDLLKESSYSFESNISDYASRFKLVFVAGSAADEMEDFAFFSNGNLVVANNGQATLQVIDINGRVLRSERINGSANVSLNESAGVYVLRLVNGENVKNQKIIIK